VLDVARGARIIDDRRVITGSGPLSWIDVALQIIPVIYAELKQDASQPISPWVKARQQDKQ